MARLVATVRWPNGNGIREPGETAEVVIETDELDTGVSPETAVRDIISDYDNETVIEFSAR